jgi:hypothetical protein
VKEFKVAQLPIFEANTTRRLRPTKKKHLKKEATHNTTTHLIKQQLIV